MKKLMSVKEYEQFILQEFRKDEYEGCSMVTGFYELILPFTFNRIIQEKGIANKVKKMCTQIFECLFVHRQEPKDFTELSNFIYLLFRGKLNEYLNGKDYDYNKMVKQAGCLITVLLTVESLPCEQRFIFRLAMFRDDTDIAHNFRIPIKDVVKHREAAVLAIQERLQPDAKEFFYAFIEHHGGFEDRG